MAKVKQPKRLVVAGLFLAVAGVFAGWYFTVRNDPNETTFTEVIDSVSAETRNFDVMRDIVYADPIESQRQILDIYTPKQVSDQPRPLIVWLHGGGWVAGDKNDDAPFQEFIDAGYSFAAVNYRLINNDSHPAQINDVNTAIAWLKQNASDFGYNSEAIGLVGFSAGGHLASLASASANEAPFGNQQQIQAVAALAAPVDLSVQLQNTSSFQLAQGEREALEQLLDCEIDNCESLLAEASPSTYVSLQDPPVFLQYGERDTLVPQAQGENFASQLTQSGVANELQILPIGHDYIVTSELIAFMDGLLK